MQNHTNPVKKRTKKFLTFQQSTSIDKKESGLFDVTIGSFLLYQLSNVYNKKDIGLYEDDGLTVFKNKSGPQAERINKYFQKISGKMI